MGRSTAESKPSRKEFSPQKESSSNKRRRPDSVSTLRDEHADERRGHKMRRIRSRSRSRDRHRHGSRGRSTSRSRNNNGNSNGHHQHFVEGRNRFRGFNDGRENPEPTNCLGVFGMDFNTNERQLWVIFGRYGDVHKVEMVRDRFSGHSRGFAFVYFNSVRDAATVQPKPIGSVQARKGSTKGSNQTKYNKQKNAKRTAIFLKAKERLNDSLVDGMRVRVDFSVTPHGGPYRHVQHINKIPERRRP